MKSIEFLRKNESKFNDNSWIFGQSIGNGRKIWKGPWSCWMGPFEKRMSLFPSFLGRSSTSGLIHSLIALSPSSISWKLGVRSSELGAWSLEQRELVLEQHQSSTLSLFWLQTKCCCCASTRRRCRLDGIMRTAECLPTVSRHTPDTLPTAFSVEDVDYSTFFSYHQIVLLLKQFSTRYEYQSSINVIV